jgi:hypothetical protein
MGQIDDLKIHERLHNMTGGIISNWSSCTPSGSCFLMLTNMHATIQDKPKTLGTEDPSKNTNVRCFS